MAIPEEAPVGREWRGMGRFQHQVTACIDHLPFLLGKRSPQQIDNVRTLLRQTTDNGIREGLPTPLLVRTGLMRPDRLGRIEQQDPLVSPPLQVTVHRYGRLQFVLYLLEDVDQ